MREIDRTLSTDEAAKMLDIGAETLKMRAYRGTIPTTRRHNHYRYKLSDIVDIIDRTDDWRPTVPVNPENRTLTLPEAAEILQMPKMTLWARMKRGYAPQSIGKIDGKWRFEKTDVMKAKEEMEATGKLKPTRDPGEKKKAIPAKFDANYGIEFETIKAICPTCRESHGPSSSRAARNGFTARGTPVIGTPPYQSSHRTTSTCHQLWRIEVKMTDKFEEWWSKREFMSDIQSGDGPLKQKELARRTWDAAIESIPDCPYWKKIEVKINDDIEEALALSAIRRIRVALTNYWPTP